MKKSLLIMLCCGLLSLSVFGDNFFYPESFVSNVYRTANTLWLCSLSGDGNNHTRTRFSLKSADSLSSIYYSNVFCIRIDYY